MTETKFVVITTNGVVCPLKSKDMATARMEAWAVASKHMTPASRKTRVSDKEGDRMMNRPTEFRIGQTRVKKSRDA